MLTRVIAGFVMVGLLAGVLASAPVALGAEHSAAGEAKPAEAGHGEAGGKSDVNPLKTFRSDLAIWTAVVFLVVLAILWRFAWGPIAEGLDNRERMIADQIAQAAQSNAEARQLLEEHGKRLAASQDEVRAILEQARRDAEQVTRQMLDKARDETKAEHQRAVQRIDAATAGALKELADRGAQLAVDLAGRILRSEVRPEKHADLIRQAMDGFVRAGSGGNGTGSKN